VAPVRPLTCSFIDPIPAEQQLVTRQELPEAARPTNSSKHESTTLAAVATASDRRPTPTGLA